MSLPMKYGDTSHNEKNGEIEAEIVEPMSQRTRYNLTFFSLLIGIIIGVFGFIKAWVVLPYRLDQAEHFLEEVRKEHRTTQETLIRVEERLIQMDIRLKERNGTPQR